MAFFATRKQQTLRARSSHAARRNHRRGLFLERLEDRSLMALVSYWSGDNTSLDSVGTNHGTLVSGATYATGQVGQAFSLDGLDDRVQVADSPSLALTESMTIEAWVRADSLPSQQGEIFFRGDDRGGLDPYSLSLQSNGMLRWEVVSGTDAMNVWASMPLGQFVHIAATLDDATGFAGLYLNGVLVSQTSTTVRPFGSLDPASNPGIGIGNHGGYPATPHNFPFDGLIDELKVYDHALTGQEVLDNFNATRGSLQPLVSINDASAIEGDQTAAYLGNLVAAGQGGLDDPNMMIYGPDGRLYVSSQTGNSVLRYDAATGTPMPAPGKTGADFVSPGAAGLDGVRSIAFGPDGQLYVASSNSDAVLRFDATTGEPVGDGQFIAAGSGGLDTPRGLLFHSDGYLYVTTVGNAGPGPAQDAVLRYDALTSEPAGISGLPGDAVFIASGTGGMDNPTQIVFHNGSFYVASTSPSTSNSVLKFGTDGSFLGAFVPTGSGGLAGPIDLVFRDGLLYVTSWTNNKVLRYDGATGAFLDEFISGGGLSRPMGLLFEPSGSFLVASGASDEIRRYDEFSGAVFTVSLSAPFPNSVSVDFATADGTAIAGSDYTASAGTVTFAPGETTKSVLVDVLNDPAPEPDETFAVNLTNPVGGTIGDASGVGTIRERRISISDATAIEGDPTPHYRGPFIEGVAGSNFSHFTFGPDNNLYAMVGTGPGYNTVRRYDGTTGEFLDTFIPNGRIDGPREMLFRGSYFYVASEHTDEVLRYDAATGAFVDAFVTAGSGGIDGPHGMSFGPDANGDGVGELYVSGRNSANVVRYDGVTGQPLGTYVTSGSGGLSWPEGMTFDPTGTYLLVSSPGTNRILKYNAQTGAYVNVAASASLSAPKDVKFGPDGLMYVASSGNDQIVRFTATDGIHLGNYVPVGAGGMDHPVRLTFGPDGDLYVSAAGNSEILRFGTQSEAIFTVSLNFPGIQAVSVDFATANGSALAGSDYTQASGKLTFAPGKSSKVIRVPLVDDLANEPNETLTLNLSNATGSVIADSQGTGTIVDHDLTKFYVVDDGSFNRTYEYGLSGQAVEYYDTSTPNATPRGAASTAAGDRVWIVDANRTVVVYNTAGGVLGVWTAGSLPANAIVEGIATNGTDVWIVDAKSDKVYRYAGAASRTSGSQNATGNFSLNSGNKDPKDIVTDGASLWVINNASQDKVFKYNAANGALLGSWTISGGGGSPTGITLDPSSPSHLWIVDNASDRVYQFDNAVSRTSGSQSPSTSFALAAGNTNPQGIADPPVSISGSVVQPAAFDAALASLLEDLDPHSHRRRRR